MREGRDKVREGERGEQRESESERDKVREGNREKVRE